MCGESISHELSRRVLAKKDLRDDDRGLKPVKTGFSFGKSLRNANKWGYLGVYLAGMLSATARAKTFKVA